MIRHYDVILAGGGLAALCLACQLQRSALRDRSILIVDRERKERNDRTWCFWTDRPTPFDAITYRSWDRLRFITQDVATTIDLGTYRYQMIRGIDLYRFARHTLTTGARLEQMHGTVDWIRDGRDQALVSVDGRIYGGGWVFDSRFRCAPPAPRDPAHYHDLRQQFTGWHIATTRPAFTPEAPTLLDFRTPQRDGMRFLYVLPFTPRQALVEYVACTVAPVGREEHERALATYLMDVLGITCYDVVDREGGAGALTDRPFPRRIGAHVMAIGALGGRVKPSSGYAFTRIQQDSAAIVRSLLQQGHPFAVPPAARRYRRYDAALLDIIDRRHAQVVPIFTAMFTRNPIARIFRFLDEQSSLRDDLRLAVTLPPNMALRALLHS
jgi:lycopene beta-cyclase